MRQLGLYRYMLRPPFAHDAVKALPNGRVLVPAFCASAPEASRTGLAGPAAARARWSTTSERPAGGAVPRAPPRRTTATPSYVKLLAYVLGDDVIGADETHWRLMPKDTSKKWWVWCDTRR